MNSTFLNGPITLKNLLKASNTIAAINKNSRNRSKSQLNIKQSGLYEDGTPIINASIKLVVGVPAKSIKKIENLLTAKSSNRETNEKDTK